MYLVDFFKRVTRTANIPIFIYLVLNIFVITIVVLVCFGGRTMPFWQALLISTALYIISVFVALSPVGEWILRFQTGCQKIQRIDQLNFIEPLFREVYDKAKKLDPSIPDDVQLFMNNDSEPNAFATGRKTICITEGLLYIPEEQIKATLGHEFGHLAHKDTDLILLVSVGNLIITGIILGFRLIIGLYYVIFSVVAIFLSGEEGAIAGAVGSLYHLLITALVTGLTMLWTWIGTVLVMKSSRTNEYEADKFAFNLGYGNELCVLLDSIESSGKKGLFATLASSHPEKNDRIARLQKLGATYRAPGYGG